MPHVKAMVVFQGATNVAKDRFVNTLHFTRVEATLAQSADALNPLIAAFWNTPSTGDNLGKAMPAFVSRTVQVRYYDMSTPPERVPELRTFTIGSPISATSLPEEVSVVCSFHGAPPIGKRDRGRIYLGPLSSYALGGDNTVGTQVANGYRTLVAASAKALCDSTANWVIFSPTDGVTRTVEGGFCDNAFDTIRKRGPGATARNSWVAA